MQSGECHFEDGDGTLWIGTVEGGLNRATGGDMRRFDHYTKESGVLSHNSVSAITADHEGHLWVGTWGGGVNVLNRSMPQRPGRVLNATDDGLHRVEYIGTLVYDPFNNMIWIGGQFRAIRLRPQERRAEACIHGGHESEGQRLGR